MKQKDLAVALKISPSMVSRLKHQGMPVNSIAAAKRWREQCLDPSLVKEIRGWSRPEQIERTSGDSYATRALDAVHSLAGLASVDFEKWEIDLRTALRVVPQKMHKGVVLPLELWERLCAGVSAAIDASVMAEGQPPGVPDGLPEWEVEYVSNFWYGVASGDIRPGVGEPCR